MRTIQILFFLIPITFIHCVAQDDAFKSYQEVYSQSFSKEKSIKAFDFSNESKWLISNNGKSGKALKCLGAGSYQCSHGGPAIVAVLKAYELSDFVLEMDVMQNGKDYSLLDFCIFFDIKDTAHYCYAQLASKADKKTHNIFMVDGEKPKRMGASLEDGIVWGMKQWQYVRMEHVASSKTVKVYFNDKLVFELSSDRFLSGHIGFGSTNSAIKIDNFKLRAPSYKTNEKTFF